MEGGCGGSVERESACKVTPSDTVRVAVVMAGEVPGGDDGVSVLPQGLHKSIQPITTLHCKITRV
jgi:hypothetical protein